jgi:hypothetical protein
MNNKEQDYRVKTENYFMLAAIIMLLFILMVVIVNLEHFIKRKGRTLETEVQNTIKGIEDKDQILDNTCLVITGKDKDNGVKIIEEGLVKARIGSIAKQTFQDVTEREAKEAEIIIINGKSFSSLGNVDILLKYLKKGKYIIFTSMPEIDYIYESGLDKIMGIKNITESHNQQEVKFLPGFMLGGLLEFKKLDFTAPEVQLLSTAKCYVTGRKDSAIIWRNTYNGSEVYVINGPFMETNAGYGILSAVLSQIYTDYIYPVINAKVFSYTGLPYVGYENTVELEKIYNRNAMQLQKDILIPDILSITKSRSIIPVGFLIDSFTNTNRDGINNYNNKQVKKYEKDTYNLINDVSMVYSGDLKKDMEFYRHMFDNRNLRAIRISEEDKNSLKELFSKDEFKSIDAIVGPWMEDNKNFSYINENTVYIPFTRDGTPVTDLEKLELYSGVTAFGAIIQNLDFERVIYPEDERDNWINVSRKYVEFIDSYREKFKVIKSRNLSEAAVSVKQYVLNAPSIRKGEDSIELSFKKLYGESCYILRTRKEVGSITGGTIEKIEEGVYMVTAKNKEVIINLRQNDKYE